MVLDDSRIAWIMIAKVAGVLAGVLATALWFWMIGTRPVMETVVGLLIGIGFGLWAWSIVNRWLRPPDKEV